jgi:hypothetical protein
MVAHDEGECTATPCHLTRRGLNISVAGRSSALKLLLSQGAIPATAVEKRALVFAWNSLKELSLGI